MPFDYFAKFPAGLPYAEFLAQYGTADQQARWNRVYQATALTPVQRELLGSFTREMPTLVVAGTWCGDCVNQCPILARIAEACPAIQLRFYDRDQHADLAEEVSICGGHRVPTVVFLAEDGARCGMFGDRTLSQYRRFAAELTGAACSSGLVSAGQQEHATIVQEWLDEFERIQWMLRTSARLRQKHHD